MQTKKKRKKKKKTLSQSPSFLVHSLETAQKPPSLSHHTAFSRERERERGRDPSVCQPLTLHRIVADIQSAELLSACLFWALWIRLVE
ncbi:unnamed protein product, partial [Brassica oleracea var. botrytis]